MNGAADDQEDDDEASLGLQQEEPETPPGTRQRLWSVAGASATAVVDGCLEGSRLPARLIRRQEARHGQRRVQSSAGG